MRRPVRVPLFPMGTTATQPAHAYETCRALRQAQPEHLSFASERSGNTSQKVSRSLIRKPRPESGLDCFICSIFARQPLNPSTYASQGVRLLPGEWNDRPWRLRLWLLICGSLTIKQVMAACPTCHWGRHTAPCVIVNKRNRKVDITPHGEGNSKLPWRKAGQPRHLVDVVDSDK